MEGDGTHPCAYVFSLLLEDERLRPVLALFRDANFTCVFLVPFLLICVCCATPFPIENLKEGMTMEAVRENFGEPKAEEADLWGRKILLDLLA